MKRLFLSLLVFSAALGLHNALAQDWAKAKLDKSPRHSEWIDLKNGDRTVKTFVVYPEVKAKAPVVLVIHEIFGLTDWAKSLADELAAAGYIAIAPDLLSAPGKDTSSYPDQGAAIKAISALPDAQVMADLDAAADYAAKIPAANGILTVTGFCWGGGKAFAYANHNPKLKASYVFYGTGPEKAAEAAQIKCPVYGFYAEDDARIGATLPQTSKVMQEAGKTFEPVTYPGAGHGFMRAGAAPDATEANRKARDAAWERWKSLLKKLGS
ncbi:MAG: dienelactone hydrolase family protein [Chthoniobacterales bacterium]|nr:dienelactone hydrolase family protein [Chthoniobacterales bacterium]